jgi:hypothetical protein
MPETEGMTTDPGALLTFGTIAVFYLCFLIALGEIRMPDTPSAVASTAAALATAAAEHARAMSISIGEAPPAAVDAAPADALDKTFADVRAAGANWQTKGMAKSQTSAALAAAQQADQQAGADLADGKKVLEAAKLAHVQALNSVYPD